ncbi:AAA family ATPase [Sorangium sp. So ce145]|uniref:AAA family ATPase n=1 Tax=Sorangium sp. So ce145 TaxID=3133285 RepID=UPI003F61D970
MYLRKISLKNIKCFAELKLDFAGEQGEEVRRWTALLGQNGVGKSTLLQAMAVPLAGPGATRELLPVAEGWVRQGQPYGEIDAVILWTEGDAQLPRWPKKTPYNARFIVSGSDPDVLPDIVPEIDRPTIPTIIEWAGEGDSREREKINKEISRLKKTAYAEGKPGWLACGYGPFRRLSGGSQDADKILYSGRRAARFVTLFREDAALTSAAEWLIELHNTAREGDETSRRSLELVKGAFETEFLLERARLHVDARSALLQIDKREAVPFKNLSDGYRSMLALGIDLLRWLVQAFPESSEPLMQRGVVLIDELDAHLHPRWQQRIGTWLLKKFPLLQFIVATHSPFLAQIAGAGGNIVLKDTGKEVKPRVDVTSVINWRADQILTELFGLESTRSPEVEKRLARYVALEMKRRSGALVEKERAEHAQLSLDFDPLPSGLESAEDRAMADTLRRALKKHDKKLQELE